jgi:DNA-binding NarL/FixJ family response regulator
MELSSGLKFPSQKVLKAMLENIRILVVDDHSVVRSSLGLLLTKYGANVIGEAADGEHAVEMALRLRPDVILMDISLPNMDGIEATNQICKEWSEAKILALTMHSEDLYLASFLEAGGVGYVRKSAADRDVIRGILSVYQGDTFLQSEGIETLVQQYRPASKTEQPPPPEILSEREYLVLEKTVRGFTSKEIGEQLGISPRTVDTYRYRVMEKLGLSRRHELIDYALKYHLLR